MALKKILFYHHGYFIKIPGEKIPISLPADKMGSPCRMTDRNFFSGDVVMDSVNMALGMMKAFYTVMRPDENSLCEDVVLDSFKMGCRDLESKLCQIYGKHISVLK